MNNILTHSDELITPNDKQNKFIPLLINIILSNYILKANKSELEDFYLGLGNLIINEINIKDFIIGSGIIDNICKILNEEYDKDLHSSSLSNTLLWIVVNLTRVNIRNLKTVCIIFYYILLYGRITDCFLLLKRYF